jgi:hypothetical protein
MANPPDGLVGARVRGLDVLVGPARRLRSIGRLATVELEVLVAQFPASGDGEDVVDNSMNAKVGHRRGSTSATTELSTSNDGDSAEDIYARRNRWLVLGLSVSNDNMATY